MQRNRPLVDPEEGRRRTRKERDDIDGKGAEPFEKRK
jgi:hypothetical protein